MFCTVWVHNVEGRGPGGPYLDVLRDHNVETAPGGGGARSTFWSLERTQRRAAEPGRHQLDVAGPRERRGTPRPPLNAAVDVRMRDRNRCASARRRVPSDGVSLDRPAARLDATRSSALASDLRAELRAPAPFPPATCCPSVRRTHRVVTDPLGLLLDAYERHGPVFSLRVLTTRVVFMLGPAANHRILVSHAADFTWRDGALRRPDPAARRRAADDRRRLPPPLAADHAAGVPPRADRRGARHDGGGDRARASAPWRPGDRVDLYALGARARAARRDARAVRPRPRPPPRAASTPRASSSARSASTGATTGCRSCAGRARRGRR